MLLSLCHVLVPMETRPSESQQKDFMGIPSPQGHGPEKTNPSKCQFMHKHKAMK